MCSVYVPMFLMWSQWLVYSPQRAGVLAESHGEKIELYFFFVAPLRLYGKFNRREPKGGAKGRKVLWGIRRKN
jgi:hypothetical protein